MTTKMRSRALALNTRSDTPASLDVETRSVEIVAATEAPVPTRDWDTWEVVDEILLMSGVQLPESRQIPMLDAHSRFSSGDVVGSLREIRVEGGQLVGRAYFSATEDGEKPFSKICEGHLTDFSIGYAVDEIRKLQKDEVFTDAGREFRGPVNLATRWTPREVSVVPIGADPNAKARAAAHTSLEEKKMDERFKKFLQARGLAPDATDEQANAFAAALEQRAEAGATAVLDAPRPSADDSARAMLQANEAVNRAVIEERQRSGEITAMCRSLGLDALADELITAGVSIDQARKAALEKMAGSRATAPAAHVKRIEVIADARDKFRAAATHGLALAHGLKVEKPAEGSDDARGLCQNFQLLAREALAAAGVRDIPSDSMKLYERAMSMSDLPNIVTSTGITSLMEGWEQEPETYTEWVDDSGSLPDFRPQTLARVSEMGDLSFMPEGSEYKHIGFSDDSETVKLETHGAVISFTRQMFLDSNFQKYADLLSGFGEAAKRYIGDLVYDVLIANSALADGVALFHANHGNLVTPGGPVSVSALTAMYTAMLAQKDIGGKRRLRIMPERLLLPTAMLGVTEAFFDPKTFPTDASDVNIYRDGEGKVRLQRTYEPRLDDDSTKQWYMVGRKGRTVKLFWLNGNKTPYTESRVNFHNDSLDMKIRIDARAAAVSYRAMATNLGG